MERNTQYRIDSIKELREAKEKFKEVWVESKHEPRDIKDFSERNSLRYITMTGSGKVLLTQKLNL